MSRVIKWRALIAQTLDDLIVSLNQRMNQLTTDLPHTYIIWSDREVSADAEMVASDGSVFGDTSSGSVDFTLLSPSAVLGRRFTFIKVNAGGGSFNLVGDVNGSAGGHSLSGQWETVTLQARQSTYIIV